MEMTTVSSTEKPQKLNRARPFCQDCADATTKQGNEKGVQPHCGASSSGEVSYTMSTLSSNGLKGTVNTSCIAHLNGISALFFLNRGATHTFKSRDAALQRSPDSCNL